MKEPLRSKTSTIDIYIKLAQYPTLAEKIRIRMREEIFRRGIVSQDDFEAEVRQKAIDSQKREGVYDPFSQEPASVWQERKARIREYQTDFYFGFNFPTTIFEQIIQEVLSDQPTPTTSAELSFNPEIAPWELLFQQGQMYYSLNTIMDMVKEAMAEPEVDEAFREHGIDNVATSGIKIITTIEKELQGDAQKDG